MTWGTWGKQLKKTEMIALMQYYLEHGINTFDHADIYGGYTTEEDFGSAFAESGLKREQIQLISKCGIQEISENRDNTVKHYDYSKDHVIWSAEKSLKHLKTDYLDVFLLHRPSPLMQPAEIAEAITHLKAQGKIKAFGVSNFTPSQTELLAQNTDIDTNQIECSLSQHSAMHDGSLDHMMVNKIQPMAWSPLGTVFKEDNAQSKRIHEQLEVLQEKYSATKDQLLLAWILKHPAKINPVIGTTNKKRIENAVNALDINLELEDWFKLLVASQGHKVP
ncbi:aldo/keto reductase [Subsaximicrobium wynnwilliamsii]|uniref:Aldo/keto reductase n=2 Tax=Subsaximicrobium wynnwilliamsii TaxID=291179 RepID=A0A5C6ZCF5_9FLAO|nr:aldo/keto reductase [Subsaximicrobium wynnwilliamsii]TXD87086.1 aldo/keto reductase [Subsaximicrobium wynnwilliamsii]TXE00828.1 aldo/keto reductase [Subsaximicrobium wynnwilliamsii]